MKRSFSGADQGLGAVYAWEGNGKAGAGRMEIIQADSPHYLNLRLDFIRPFKATNTAEFHLTADGATNIAWCMHGSLTFAAKIMHSLINMDKLVGKDFETGLANLKALAETSSH